LNRVIAVLRQAFNGGNFAAGHARPWHNTGANGLAIDVHSTRTTLGNAAAKFGTGEANHFSNDPQQGHFGFSINFLDFAIDIQGIHAFYLQVFINQPNRT
jgi:hypothetical protein